MENSRIEQIKLFLKESPDDPFLNYALAIEYVAKKNQAEAKDIFQKLITKNPEYSATYYHYGKLLLSENKKNEAIEIFEKGIKVAKQNNEQHAASELLSALNEILYDED
ncbi:MAG: tetratricopeptide repeat protein [Bacteroidia bacterium]|nr:tetratricopeptide repeat protein [Bacteroidia bacterium]